LRFLCWFNAKIVKPQRRIFIEEGELTFSDGTVYEGGLVNGKPHGKWKMTYPDGKIEEGNWKDGKFKGKGLFG